MPLLAQDPGTSAPVLPPEASPGTTELVPGTAPAATDSGVPVAPARPAAAEPTLDLMPAQPSQGLPAPGASESEPSLIPEAPTATERPRGSAITPPRSGGTIEKEGKSKKEKKSSTDLSTGELQQMIRFRQAKTRALGDPAVQAEWRQSEVARTDFEKRAALKRYYTLLYARMGKLDGSLKKQITERSLTSLHRLEQKRIEGTEQPLELAEETSRTELE